MRHSSTKSWTSRHIQSPQNKIKQKISTLPLGHKYSRGQNKEHFALCGMSKIRSCNRDPIRQKGDSEEESEWDRVAYWKVTPRCHGNGKQHEESTPEQRGHGKEDGSTNGKEPEEHTDDESRAERREVCLFEWWCDYWALKEFPHKEIEELVEEPKSTVFRYLSLAEELREKYGDSAFPTEERYKRRKYEVAVGAKEQLYTERYDRKRMHDPKTVPRYNKKRRTQEQFEDYGQTWISRHDDKPCGCNRCRPCPVCGRVRCRRNLEI